MVQKFDCGHLNYELKLIFTLIDVSFPRKRFNYLYNIKQTLESKKTLFYVYVNVLVSDTEILCMIQILMHGNFFHLTFLEDTPTSCNQIYCILRYKIKHKTDSLRVCSSLQCYRSFIIPFISKLHRNFDSTLLKIILFQQHNPRYDISHLKTKTCKLVTYFITNLEPRCK